MNISKIYFLILFCCCCQLSLDAQQSLSLDAAVKLGLKNNFDVKIAKLKQSIQENNREIGVPGRLPTVGFKIQQSNRLSKDNSPTSFTDGGYSKNEISAGLDLEWVLFDGYQVRINQKRLSFLEEQSAGMTQLMIENTLQAIILAYYKALIESEKLKVLQEVRAFSLHKYENGRTELKYGDISRFDYYNFENALLEDSINCHVQENTYNQALIQLNGLMGVNKNYQYELTEELVFKDKNYDYNTLQWKLVSSNQDIRSQYMNISLQKNATRLMRAQRKPSVSLRSGLNDEMNTSKFSGEAREQGGLFDYYVNFTVAYKIFDGGKLKKQIQEMQILEHVEEQKMNKLKAELSEKLQLNVDSYQRQRKVLNLRKRLITNLDRNLKIAEERLKNGESKFIEFRDLQIKLLESELEMLQTIFDLKVAETEITRLVKDKRGAF